MHPATLIAALKDHTPWYGKIAAKLVLARLPISRAAWHRVRLFQSGDMHRPDYALGVFRSHFARSPFHSNGRPFSALELGPGRSLLSGLIAYAHGADHTYLIDVDNLATDDVNVYLETIAMLQNMGLRVPSLGTNPDVRTFLEWPMMTYSRDGLRDLRAIPADSVDFSWSQAVLEHVSREEIEPTLKELYRITKRGGISSHNIDYSDHLAGALNNLRFADRVWESSLVSSSGFYTNRIRPSEICSIAGGVGFEVEALLVARWPQLPTDRRKMAPRFRAFDDDDLTIRGQDVLLRKA